jgi:hypothetical protein
LVAGRGTWELPLILRALSGIDSYRFARIGFGKVQRRNCRNDPLDDHARLDLVTVAFNNEHVIAEQIRLLRKNLKDPFCYTVADNSADDRRGVAIERLCFEEGVPYLRLPRVRTFVPAPSLSHGRALNWLIRNYIGPRRARYFGLLDHDVFPMRPTTVIAKFSNAPAWGHLQRRDHRWYLWPGLCFFDASEIAIGELDFMPGRGTDTGGRNYESLFSSLDEEALEPPSHTYGRLREGDGSPQSNLYEEIGDWLHTFNASQWMPAVAGRERLVAELLSRF